MRLKHFVVMAAVLVAAGIAMPRVASAGETGMAYIHDLKRYGRLLCMVSHSHRGSSTGQRTRSRAYRAAVRDWREFTAWEYGTSWARWRYARGKQRDCQRHSNGWSCTVDARPCGRVRGRRR